MPAVCLQFEGAANALNIGGRSGVRFPIDAAKYKRLSFRARRSVTPANAAGDLMAAYWYVAPTRDASSFGARTFVAQGHNPHANRYDNQTSPTTPRGDPQI